MKKPFISPPQSRKAQAATVRATLYDAESATSDSLLNLELAYKHDPIVIALIRQVQQANKSAQAESDMLYEKEKENDDLEAKADSLEGELDKAKEQIGKAASELRALSIGFTKAEVMENINEIAEELEGWT